MQGNFLWTCPQIDIKQESSCIFFILSVRKQGEAKIWNISTTTGNKNKTKPDTEDGRRTIAITCRLHNCRSCWSLNALLWLTGVVMDKDHGADKAKGPGPRSSLHSIYYSWSVMIHATMLWLNNRLVYTAHKDTYFSQIFACSRSIRKR